MGNIKSLSRKFFWILLFGVIFFFGLLTYLILQREKTLILNIYKEEVTHTVDVIARDISYMMVDENPSAVAENIRAFNEPGKVRVGVVGPKGSSAFNTGVTVPEEIVSSQKDYYAGTDNEFIFYKPLTNDKRCHHCHSAKDKTRGMVVIRTSMRQAQEEIAKTAKRLIYFAFFIGLTSEVFLLVILRKKILRPLEVMNEGANLLKAGRLDHRIEIKSSDEIGALASCFNDMARSIELSHHNLENAVRQRTKELRVIAELSTEVFRGNLTLGNIIEQFLSAITEKLDFGFASLCLVDKETGLLSQEFSKGIDSGFCAMEISLASEHPFTNAIREAKPSVKSPGDIGAPEGLSNIVIVPILSHQRKRCREINLCAYEDCPAFFGVDERCWLIEGTLCRSPQAVAGKGKIYGCLHCEVFPVLGVLVAGSKEEINKSSLHSLEILASELASAIENQRFIESKKEDINRLINLHDVSVESLQNLGEALESAIVSSATAFSNTYASILCLLGNDGRLHLGETFRIDAAHIPTTLPVGNTFFGRAITEDRPVETIDMKNVTSVSDLVTRYGFMYAASIPLKCKDTVFGCLALFKKSDFLMTDSEKAVTLLFASQAAAAMNTSRIYKELRAEKEFSDAIFNNASSGIMVLDTEGRVLKMNGIGADFLRVDIDRTVGSKITGIFPETKGMLVFGIGLGREITIALPNGTNLPIGFTNSPLFDSRGMAKGIIVLFKEMTEIKRLQAELRKKEHFETIGKVISGVAHEIRNPLFGISSIGQILERELDSPQHKALTQAMLKETDRMKRLIEELLLYTKPSRLEIRDLDVASVFEELKHYIKAKKDTLSLLLDIPPLTIAADRDKITQVFLNLLNNAIDAARQTIRVSARNTSGRTEIKVSDDGNGIREEDLCRVFDPFFTTKKGGTGLGLPICRKIVEDHGGEIEIQSIPGEGTTVTLSFKS